MQCTWEPSTNASTSEVDCNDIRNFTDPRGGIYGQRSQIPFMIDAFYTVAHAIHNYISDKCPTAFRHPNLADGCIVPADLLAYMYAVNFTGKFIQTSIWLIDWIKAHSRTSGGETCAIGTYFISATFRSENAHAKYALVPTAHFSLRVEKDACSVNEAETCGKLYFINLLISSACM